MAQIILGRAPGFYSGRPVSRLALELSMRDGRTIDVSFWVRAGHPDKTAIVILPGLDEQAIAWRRVLKRFHWRSNRAPVPELGDRTVVIINMRGQGPTRESELERYGSSPRSIPRADQLMILRAVLDHLAIDRSILVGHSYGGGVALGALADDELRRRLSAAVLLAPHVSHFERFATNHLVQLGAQAAAWFELLNPFAYETSAAACMPLLFEQALRDGDLCPFTREWNDDRIGFLSAMTLGLMRIETDRDLDALRDDPRAVHLVIADHDHIIPEGAHEHLYESIPEEARGCYLKPEGSGHRIHQDDPEAIAEVMAEVAARCDEVQSQAVTPPERTRRHLPGVS